MRGRAILLFFAGLMVFSPAVSGETFGSVSGPLPNVTSLEVYEVTGLSSSEKETGGKLVASGLNTTLEIRLNSTEQYRFTFKVENDGGSAWKLESADELFHKGLNTSWNVDKTWYNNTSQQFTGGTFSSGKVSWDTSLGGKVDPSGVLYAKYLVSVPAEDDLYSQRFEVNDTSNSSGSYDLHRLNTTEIGYLDVELEAPANNTILRQNRTFLVESNVTCRDGLCGDVGITPRYNSSSEPDTTVPLTGDPFNTNDTLKSCSGLGRGELCEKKFFVNASGKDPSYHELDVNASADVAPRNDSSDSQVSIETVILFDLNWSTVDFGSVPPGRENVSAEGNARSEYNVTVDEDSIEIDSMWIRSTGLESNKLDYSINASNMSYSLQNDIDTENKLSETYQKFKSSVSPGSVFSLYFWLDVPTGIYNGGYSGSIYIKGNESV